MARQNIPTTVTAPPLSARAAGLHYVCDTARGINTQRRGSLTKVKVHVDDEGKRRVVTSADVNAYLREATGAEFTAKDFRTWAGTLLAAVALRDEALEPSSRKQKSTLVRAVSHVATHLGNTPSVCRACYIHPSVLEAYSDGTLQSAFTGVRRPVRDLSADKAAVLALIENRRDWHGQIAEAARAA